MKVIAQTETGWLLEATPEEIANICGFYSELAESYNSVVVIGDEVKVSDIYNQFIAIAGKKSILEAALVGATEAKDKLCLSIQSLDSLTDPIVKPVILEG